MKGLEFLNDYKKMIPIFMGVLLVGSIYGRVNAAHEDTLTYEEHLNAAREYRGEKIYATSKEEYEKALEMRESLDLYIEVAEMLKEEGDDEKLEDIGELVAEKYPNEPLGYEALIRCYKDLENYGKCFEQYEIVKKRGISSDEIEDMIMSIKYEYRLEGTEYEYVTDFVKGYATYLEGNRFGLVSEEGKEPIKEMYEDMSACDGEYVAVTDENNESYYIDLNGERRFNFPKDIKVKKIGKLYKGIMPVYTDDKVYYYTAEDGKQILGPYDDGEAFSNGLAAVREGDKWYLISTDGTKETEGYEGFYMNTAGGVVSNNRAFANIGEGYIMLDENLQPVGNTVYEAVKAFGDDSYAAVKKDGLWGFIDKDGIFAIKPAYENACSFCHGLAPAYENGAWGFIDSNGKWAIKPIFAEAKTLNESGCGFVREEGKDTWSIIKFIEFNYD
ncbi:MAG: WG repeat-containing protein [Butyrivibrio sp.]|nr:WG repeat-containing protein [Butyrivibrio sp.]